ncbi:major royal jelly protein [Pyrenophora tritici-repentis]|nr:major royal jelly protein [Pyrenophora tritici-repentis]KAI2481484.1 major royal jelly protein [Pyrenophora tritici-repentis]
MKSHILSLLVLLTPSTAQITFQDSSSTILRTDNGTHGPPMEEYHYYHTQWPIGLAISSTGRFFATYTRGTYAYTLGEAVNKTAEKPYPSLSHQVPVSQLNTSWSDIPFGSNNSTGLISVQALYITPASALRPETLWVVDTGRPTIHDADGTPSMPYAAPGGPKILAISLDNDTVYATYTFPVSVHYPDSYMNDIRLDLRPSVTDSGGGIVYIIDSSDEGRPGFIMLDLGTGQSWRRLTQDASTLRVPRDVPSYQGHPFYQRIPGGGGGDGGEVQTLREGNDGIQISPDGETIFYSPLTSNKLYSIPASFLRAPPSPLADIAAQNAIAHLGGRGGNANGFEGDDHGRVYMCMPEQNAIYIYDPRTLQTVAWVRDPRIIWPDGVTVGQDGWLYVNVNQLPYQPDWNGGVDGRVFPGVVLRIRLEGGAGKIVGLV